MLMARDATMLETLENIILFRRSYIVLRKMKLVAREELIHRFQLTIIRNNILIFIISLFYHSLLLTSTIYYSLLYKNLKF